MSMTTSEFLELRRQAATLRREEGRAPGPCYGAQRPVIWYDQRFGSALALVDTVECPTALRVGSTQEALDIAIAADMDAPLTVAEGSSITLVILEADSPDDVFTESGPSICVTAPTGGMTAEPGALLVRLPVGNRNKPWMKVRLLITGSIQGQATVALAYRPR